MFQKKSNKSENFKSYAIGMFNIPFFTPLFKKLVKSGSIVRAIVTKNSKKEC